MYQVGDAIEATKAELSKPQVAVGAEVMSSCCSGHQLKIWLRC